MFITSAMSERKPLDFTAPLPAWLERHATHAMSYNTDGIPASRVATIRALEAEGPAALFRYFLEYLRDADPDDVRRICNLISEDLKLCDQQGRALCELTDFVLSRPVPLIRVALRYGIARSQRDRWRYFFRIPVSQLPEVEYDAGRLPISRIEKYPPEIDAYPEHKALVERCNTRVVYL